MQCNPQAPFNADENRAICDKKFEIMEEMRKKYPDLDIKRLEPVFEKVQELRDFLTWGETSTSVPAIVESKAEVPVESEP